MLRNILINFTTVVFLVLVACEANNAFGQQSTASGSESETRSPSEVRVEQLKRDLGTLREISTEDRADIEIFLKGLTWAMRFDRKFSPEDQAIVQRSLDQAAERISALKTNCRPWREKRGSLALGHVSRVDDSVQPLGLIVPQSYDPSRAIRLDVVLHGSSSPVGMSELRFINRFLDQSPAAAGDQPYLELHPLGRVENCYRWAGETDVFEAIEEVCRRYNVDRQRIVLRGMSMGASGTWHLGLKHPDKFVALGPYCGYVDTHKFSETPISTFVKVGPLPPHQELGLHMLDSVDYAANARTVPAIACMGDKDVFFQAHVIMGEAMQREGLAMVNLISPGTGHVIDPATHAEQMRRIAEFAQRGLELHPARVAFTTWTLKYNQCHWIEVLGLEQHYARADIEAQVVDDGISVTKLRNIDRFAILPERLARKPKWIRINDSRLDIANSLASDAGDIVLVRQQGTWTITSSSDGRSLAVKRPGLQGPIDDAFSSRFLCVRGTGRPWHPAVQDYAEASLKRFAEEWTRYFRGELLIKADTEVTPEDLKACNLILFGDPGSNSWIARVLPQLPLNWTAETLSLAGHDYTASDHLPALIAPNPLADGQGRYVVLNSGHTFREAELAKLNYLLFPRWGDWAALKIHTDAADPKILEIVERAGYFDERWQPTR